MSLTKNKYVYFDYPDSEHVLFADNVLFAFILASHINKEICVFAIIKM